MPSGCCAQLSCSSLTWRLHKLPEHPGARSLGHSSPWALTGPIQTCPCGSCIAASWLVWQMFGKVSVQTWNEHWQRAGTACNCTLPRVLKGRAVCPANFREQPVINSCTFHWRCLSFFPRTLHLHILLRKKKTYFLREPDPAPTWNKCFAFAAMPTQAVRGQGWALLALCNTPQSSTSLP